jgi:hypothetical protein
VLSARVLQQIMAAIHRSDRLDLEADRGRYVGIRDSDQNLAQDTCVKGCGWLEAATAGDRVVPGRAGAERFLPSPGFTIRFHAFNRIALD